MASQKRSTRLTVSLLLIFAFVACAPRALRAAEPPECVLPGISLGVDATGDADPQLGSPDVDIREAFMSQATSGVGPSMSLTVTMKVVSLDPGNLPINRIWRVIWKNTANGLVYFAGMSTCDVTNSPDFEYGWLDPSTGVQTTLGSGQGVLANDGTIQVTVPRSVIGNPQTGALLDSVVADTRLLLGAQCTGSLRQLDQLACVSYTITGTCTGPPPPPESRCIVPGLLLATDPVGDATGTPGSTPGDDIVALSIAEPWWDDLRERMTFTIKVDAIDPGNVPLDRQWFFYFIAPTDPETTFFVSIRTCGATTPVDGPAYGFGFINTTANNLRTGLGNCFGEILPTGELRIVMPKDTVGTNTATGAIHWYVPVGVNIFGVQGFSYLLAGGNCTGLLEPFDQADASLEYHVTGNQYCQPYTVTCAPAFAMNDGHGAGRDTTIQMMVHNPSTATRSVNVHVSDDNGWIASGPFTASLSMGPGVTSTLPVNVHVPGQCTPSVTDAISMHGVASDLPAPANEQECATEVTCLPVTSGVDHGGTAGLSFALRGPNPANERTLLGFTLPAREHVKMEVFSLTGQRVRTLLDGVRDAGSYTVPFELRDSRGNRMGPGVYMVRLTTAQGSKTLHVVGLH